MLTFMLSLNWTEQGIRAVKDAPKLPAISPRRWALRSSRYISRRATAISYYLSIRRAAITLPNSRWRSAQLATCARAPPGHGRRQNSSSWSPSCREPRRDDRCGMTAFLERTVARDRLPICERSLNHADACAPTTRVTSGDGNRRPGALPPFLSSVSFQCCPHGSTCKRCPLQH